MIRHTLLGLLSLLFVFITCTREHIAGSDEVCFETEVLPIFQSNCTQSGCHNSRDRKEGYDLSTYENIIKKGIRPGDYKNSEIYQALVRPGGEAAMPPKPYNRLSDDQITTIALWIENGAANGVCDTTTVCNTANVTYAAVIKPLLVNYCNGCHSGNAPSGNIDYTTYAGVKKTADNGTLLGSVQHASGYRPMPDGGNQLSACNIARIKAWIDAGAPDN
jgi:mono/diheme cytochrome c family protein